MLILTAINEDNDFDLFFLYKYGEWAIPLSKKNDIMDCLKRCKWDNIVVDLGL
jgi:hypothetical protein